MITVTLPNRVKYVAFELQKQIQKNTRLGMYVAYIALTIVLGVYLGIQATQEEFVAPTIVPIGSLIVEAIDNAEEDSAEEEKIQAEPQTQEIIQHGPAARAGTPVPVPDSEITADMQEFADMDVVDRASSEGGDGIDLGGMASNISFEEEEVVIKEKMEEIPKFDDFIAVEKEAEIASLSDLQAGAEYPKLALKANIEGTVIVKVFITRAGKPTHVGILSSDNKILNQAAMDAVKKYKGFTPAMQNQQPVGMWLTIPIKFQLN
jgi:TonB family protein